MTNGEMEQAIRDRLAVGPLAGRTGDVLDVLRPAVELLPYPVPPDELPLGHSRLGGPADLPAEAEWPFWRGEPQSLIAQIRLQDVAGLPGTEPLPDFGWLTFFYTARQDTWGFDPEDRGSWTVLHLPPDADLVRRSPPGGIPARASTLSAASNTVPPGRFRPGSHPGSTPSVSPRMSWMPTASWWTGSGLPRPISWADTPIRSSAT